MKPVSDDSNNSQDPVTKEQSLELVRYRLVPGHLISRMSARQAQAMLRRHRRKRFGLLAVRVFVGVVILASLAGIGYKAWERWGGPSEPVVISEGIAPPDPPPVRDRMVMRWDWGSWAPWIGDERYVLVLDRLPADVEKTLRRQNELFQAVLSAKEEEPQELDAADIARWQSRFPGGEDVTADYTSTSSRSRATGSGDYASAGGTSTGSSSSGRKGVLVALQKRYSAYVSQFKPEHIGEQLSDFEIRVVREIADLESRAIRPGANPRGAQTEATLRWLSGQVLPYVRDFRKYVAESGPQGTGAMEDWREFQVGEKERMEVMIDGLTTARIPLEEDAASVPRDQPVLLEAKVGSRRIVFLPDSGGQITTSVGE